MHKMKIHVMDAVATKVTCYASHNSHIYMLISNELYCKGYTPHVDTP